MSPEKSDKHGSRIWVHGNQKDRQESQIHRTYILEER